MGGLKQNLVTDEACTSLFSRVHLCPAGSFVTSCVFSFRVVTDGLWFRRVLRFDKVLVMTSLMMSYSLFMLLSFWPSPFPARRKNRRLSKERGQTGIVPIIEIDRPQLTPPIRETKLRVSDIGQTFARSIEAHKRPTCGLSSFSAARKILKKCDFVFWYACPPSR